MAINVLVIPEDFRKDQFVLKPIVEQMMRSVGVTARVTVCKDPLLGGVEQALKWERLEEILFRYKGTTRVFLLVHSERPFLAGVCCLRKTSDNRL